MKHTTILRASLRIRALVKTFKRSGFFISKNIAVPADHVNIDSLLRGNDNTLQIPRQARDDNANTDSRLRGNDNAGKDDNARSDRRLDTGPTQPKRFASWCAGTLRRYDRKKLGYDKERGKDDRGARYNKTKTTLKKKLNSNTHTTINSMQFILTRQNSIFKKRFAPVVVVMTLFSLIVGQSNLANAATHTFVQNDWSGGATTNTASHLTATSGWTQYSSTAGVSPSGLALTLDSGSRTVTHTLDGDFSAGAHTNATTSSGGVKLTLASPITSTSTKTTDTDWNAGTYVSNSVLYDPDTGSAGTAGASVRLSKSAIPTWFYTSSPVNLLGSGMAVDTLNQRLYAGSGRYCNLSSECDESADWTAALGGSEVLFDSANGVLYRPTANSMVYRCNETVSDCTQGGNWTSYTIATPRPGTLSDIIHDYDQGVLYIQSYDTGATSGQDQILRCNIGATGCDAGEDWQIVKDLPWYATYFHFTYDSTQKAIFFRDLKCLTSTGCDASGEWIDTNNGIDFYTFDSTHNVLYGAALNGSYIYRCVASTGCDTAGEWTSVYGMGGITYRGPGFNPTNGYVYFGANSNIYKCDTATGCDASGEWSLDFTISQTQVGYFFHESLNNNMYVTGYNSSIYRTYNPYNTPGIYRAYIDASSGASYAWNNFSFDKTTSGFGTGATTIQIRAKSNDSATTPPADIATTGCQINSTTSDGTFASSSISSCAGTGRYLWFEATLTGSTDLKKTPSLDAVSANVSVSLYNTPGTYESTAINTGQKTKDGSVSLSWSETLNGAGTDAVQLQMSSSNETYSDNFDGGSLDAGKWSISGVGTSSLQNGSLYISANDSHLYVLNTHTLSGDFDIQTDFSNFTRSGDFGALTFLVSMGTDSIKIERRGGSLVGGDFILTEGSAGGVYSSGGVTYTGASGKFRLTRTGTTLNAYYYNNSWQLLKTYSNSSTANGTIYLFARAADGTGSVAGNFDNFIVWGDNNGDTSGAYFGSTGATSTYYTAESGTTLHADHNGSQYFRYKATLTTSNTSVTPTLDAVNLSYQYYGNKGPVGLWHFDGTVGAVANGASVFDASGFGSHGTASNANGAGLAYTDQTGNLDALGTSMTFDGTDDYVNVIDNGNLSGMNAFSSEAWVNVSQLPASGHSYGIISKESGPYSYRIDMGTSGNLAFTVATVNNGWYTTGTNAYSPTGLTTGGWHHVVGTYDGSYVRIYVDGNLKATGSQAISGSIVSTPAVNLQIGKGNGVDPFNGLLDDVSIYDRALSATEIAAHYNSGIPSAAVASGAQDSVLISSAYNSTDSTNALASIRWATSSLPTNTSVKFQLRTAPDSAGAPGTWTAWAGPDGSATTYFTAGNGSESLSSAIYNTNAQWFQYKMIVSTNGNGTPTVTSVTTTYVVNAPPTASISSASQIATTTDADWGKVKINFSLQDTDTVTSFATTTFAYNNGGTWTTIPANQIRIADALGATVTSPLAVSPSIATAYTAYWTAAGNISTSTNTFSIRISANDGQPANATGTATTANFSVDTITPTVNYLTFDAGTVDLADSASITISAPSDFSTVYYQLSDGTTTSTWTAISATTTAPWTFSSPIEAKSINLQLRDAYGNYGATSTYTGPAAIDPALFFIQDVTKLAIGDYRLYVGWATSSAVSFASYKVEYATSSDNSTFGSYTLVQSIADNATAYFVHSGLNLNLYYKYRISIVDTSGNVSLRSGFVTARPDGVQNFGEGGGGSVATASYITNVVPTQNTANGTVSATYTLTDSSITSKTSPSYEGYLLYNIGVTLATSTANSITLSDATKLPATGFIQVNHEIIGYASKSGNVLNGLTRGTWPTAATTRTSRQNSAFFVGTPVWIVASSTTPVSISNSTISSGQSGTITWNTLAETTLAGSSYSNIGIRALVHDNQPASSGPLSSQNDQTDDGVLSALDLTAPTIQFTTSSASAAETASASTTLTATLSKPYALAVAANYTTGGTAVLNTDYLMASTTATLTFASGTTTATLSVKPLNNLLYGADKTVIITLSNPSNATLGSINPLTFTITETDAQPAIAFATSTGAGAETTSSVSIPVTLSVVSSATTTASYAVSASSTAVSGANYTLAAGTVSFAAGTTTASIPLTIIHDGIYSSPNRTVIVTLSSPSGAALGTTTSFTYTITDADLIPQINFALATSTVAETGATTTINVTLSYASNQEISIPVTVNPSSTAVSNTNYTIATSTITVPAGRATSSIAVVVLHDAAYGAAKTLILSLGSASGMTLGASTTHTLTITEVDNAAPEVSSVTASQVASSSDVNFGKVSIAYSVRDANTASGIINPNYITPTFEYNSGLGWNAITSLRAEDTTNKSVAAAVYAPYTAVWDVRTQLGSVSLSDVQIRVNANDNESLNGIGRGTSTSFTIDTQAPQVSTLRYDGRTGLLSMTVTDTNPITYTLSNNADMSVDGVNAASGIATATGTTATLSSAWTVASTSPRIYLSVTDSFGNSASTSRAIPESVTGIAFYDTSDMSAGLYKEFITWNVYSSTTTTFASYTLYRSTDGGSTFTSSSTIADAATNYYLDTNLSTSTTYAYKLTVTDTAGTVSAYSATVSDQPDGKGATDLAAPTITSAQAVSVQNVSATITWTTDEISDSTVNWGTTTAYGSTATSSTLVQNHSVTLTGLTPNTAYVFRVKSKDASTNEATADNGGAGYAFTTGGGPIITGIAASATDRAATITWNTNRNSNSVVTYSKNSAFNGYNDVTGTVTPVGDASTTNVFAHSVSITGLESGAFYYYKVKSVDSQGNETIDNNGGSYYTFQTLSDVYAPTISNLSTPVTTSASVVVFWKTDELATSQVQYDLTSTSTFANSSTLDTTYSIYHSIVVAGLPADTTYNYRVRSTDAFGNEAVSTTTTFSTAEEGEVTIVTVGGGGAGIGQFTEAPEAKDTTAPVISSTSIATTTPFGATITIATNEPTSVFIEYGKDTNYGGVSGNYQLTQSHIVDISGLRFGTSYHFRVRVTDKSGNVTVSEDKLFDTKFVAQASPELRTIEDIQQYEEEIEATIASILPGILPPFIEQPAVSDITENSATITWRTNVRTYSSVLYSTEEEYVKTPEKPYTAEVADNSSKVTDHSILLIGLKPNTKYHIMARSFSLPQAVGSSNDLTFTTKAPAVQASIIDVKTTSFRAAWTTDVPASSIVEYKNLKTGVIERIIQEPLVAYHDILVDNLRPGTRYEVRVLGYSEQGNLLSSGVPMNVLTSTDISAPKISNFKVDGALVPGRTDRIQTIVSWTTDEPATGIVEYQEGAGSVAGGFANKVTITDSYVTNHVVILTSLKPGTIYQFKITSSDQAGNTASFGPRTIITPQKGESIFDVIFKNFEDTFKFLRGAGQ